MNRRAVTRACIAVVLILLPVVAPMLAAEFRQVRGAQQQGGVA